MAGPMDYLPSSRLPLLQLQWVAYMVIGLSCLIQGQVLQPPVLNLAERKPIIASSTCGVGEHIPEMYCRLTGVTGETFDNSVIVPHIKIQAGQLCEYCDSTMKGESHPAEFAVDGSENWWQSPPLSRGIEYNKVNITVDLGQEFQVSYIWIKMAKSPRPGVWVLERSNDFGKTWSAWQYFATSNSECKEFFDMSASNTFTKDDEAICTTEFSGVVPLENGEIIVSLINNRPSARIFPSSEKLQEWTRATNVRLRLLSTNTLRGNLMAVARQDITVTRRYFYSIKEIFIGGTCVCNGHAESCDKVDPKNTDKRLCNCQHNTCGPQCGKCCPGFEQKKWRPVKINDDFMCEPCNCHDHSNSCKYNPEVDRTGGSLDIHGKRSGGGVCKDCQHFTEGLNCEQCRKGYYRNKNVPMTHANACKPCQCVSQFSTGDCDRNTGQCTCKPKYTGKDCDRCNVGYHTFPQCLPCDCHQTGTRNGICQLNRADTFHGQCPCKPNYTGLYCKSCQQGFFGFPRCQRCICNNIGAKDSYCDVNTGQCRCQTGFSGRFCDQCAVGYYGFRTNCRLCDCEVHGCIDRICNRGNGRCICKPNYIGRRCDQCKPGFYQYPKCLECRCNPIGAMDTNCRDDGQCSCKRNFAGRMCNQCAAGYYRFPECITCNCSDSGSQGQTCNQNNGRCVCHDNFEGNKCERCKQNYYKYPQCIECNCHPSGAVQIAGQPLGGCGTKSNNGQTCRCKERVTGLTCNMCKPGYWNLGLQHQQGCSACQCNAAGTTGGFDHCDWKSGQCMCKPLVNGRSCDQCVSGSYNLLDSNPFGCQSCGCNLGGSEKTECSQNSGQCSCKQGVEGPKCDRASAGRYFPTMHQHEYEIEEGLQVGGGKALFKYDDTDFPGFSWKGYAIISSKQREILLPISIDNPVLCRIVVRYFNNEGQKIRGTIALLNTEQTTSITFNPSNKPEFTKLSDFGIPFVLNPGEWTLSIKAPKDLLLDYLVLIPQQYYEPTVLQIVVNRQCTIPNDNGPCLHYKYPPVERYPSTSAAGISVNDSWRHRSTERLYNNTILNEFGVPDMVLIDGDTQSTVSFKLQVAKRGEHILVINYYNPGKGQDRPHLIVSTSDGQFGSINLYQCQYSTLCRQTVTDYNKKIVKTFSISKHLTFKITGENVHAYIESVIAIPKDEWNIRFIQPRLVCVRVNKVCVNMKHQTVAGSVKIEAESGRNHYRRTTEMPEGLNDSSVGLVKLDSQMPSIELAGTVRTTNQNVVLVHYYQPKYPGFPIDVNLYTQEYLYSDAPSTGSGNQFPSEETQKGTIQADYCPSAGGCRAIVNFGDKGEPNIDLQDNEVRIKLKTKGPSKFWLDNILLIPDFLYKSTDLEQPAVDLSEKFLTKCTDASLTYRDNPSCREMLFTLVTDYNNGTLPCDCNRVGSISSECESLGGQCQCQQNVIGRDCSACRPGYFGFPNCQRCQCRVGLCHPVTGDCVCPPHVTGRNCDSCLPETYAYDPYVGCKDCDCNAIGVRRGDLNCDQTTGKCRCHKSFGGRTCDKCAAGHHNKPRCTPCSCNNKGAEDDICDPETGRCLCKKNVEANECVNCLLGSFYLEKKNPNGCTNCFCFGIISSCGKSQLRWSPVTTVRNWNIHNTVGVNIITTNFIKAKVDGRVHRSDEAIYWSAPSAYLGNKIPSYGGQLRYKIVFSSEPNSVATAGPDVILVGNNMSLAYYSNNPPENNQRQEFIVDLREYTFIHELHNSPVKREQFMMVLAHLDGIYIKGNYLSMALELRLSNIQLDYATENGRGDLAHTVEVCHCPPSYRGTSCEKCAPGHYRRRKKPFFGSCSPCECNGHTKRCDPTTGECLYCGNNTMGYYCHECKPGYSGDPAIGPCTICSCPLNMTSNNFAVGCITNNQGKTLRCECLPGYRGAKCDKCAPGYYGNPLVVGGKCEPCNCNENIDLNIQNSCDSKTGECKICTNNTSGKNCQFCKSGWYGDAVKLKDCKACECDKCGTSECDNQNGQCYCQPNTEGTHCDRCLTNHYGFNECDGCKRCDCNRGSRSQSCEAGTGQCECLKGVGGRTCDQCLDGFWNYRLSGCQPCPCASSGVSKTCDPISGDCRCVEGYVGVLCDRCQDGWVQVPGEGCRQCDNCTMLLLSDLSLMRANFSNVVRQLQSLSVGIRAQEELTKVKRNVDDLRPKVDKLLRTGRDLNFTDEIHKLMKKAKDINRKAKNTKRDTADMRDDAKELLRNSQLPELKDLLLEINRTLDYIKSISRHLGGQQRGREEVIAKATEIYKQIRARKFSRNDAKCKEEIKNAQKILEKVKRKLQRVVNLENNLNKTNEMINDIKRRLEDIFVKINESNIASNKTLEILDQLNISKIMTFNDEIQKRMKALKDAQENTRDKLNDTKQFVEDIKSETKDLPRKLSQLDGAISRLRNELTNELLSKLPQVRDLVNRAINHSDTLQDILDTLQDQYTDFKNISKSSLDAATAYKNIVNAIREAKVAANKALADGTKAQKKSAGVKKDAEQSKNESEKQLTKVNDVYDSLKKDADKLLSAANGRIDKVNEKNNKIMEEMKLNNATGSRLKRQADRVSKLAENANDISRQVNDRLQNMEYEDGKFKKLNLDDLDDNKIKLDINIGFKQLNGARKMIPSMIDNLSNMTNRVDSLLNKSHTASLDLKKLKELINMARSEANEIIVGLKLFPNTTLRLRNPITPMSYSYNKISMYVNPQSGNGLLAYVGSPEDSSPMNKDFLSLELEDSKVVLKYNLGSGKAAITNPFVLVPNEWHYIEAKRIGTSGTLMVSNDKGDKQTVNGTAKGTYSMLEIDPDTAFIYAGGFPANMNNQIPGDVTRNRYHGAMEGFTINDLKLGLWNFISGEDNFVGFRNRKAVIQETTGYRFVGNSYAELKPNFAEFQKNLMIEITFKTYESDGLLMMMYHDKETDFASLDIRQGHLVFQYDLGKGRAFLKSTSKYNDGNWHSVRIKKQNNRGIMFINNTVDNINGGDLKPKIRYFFSRLFCLSLIFTAYVILRPQDAVQGQSPNGMNMLSVNKMYIGGYRELPRKIVIQTNISDHSFIGCIRSLQFNNILDGFSQKESLFNLNPGCPDVIAQSLRFPPYQKNYVRTKYQIMGAEYFFTMKFKVGIKQNNSLLLHTIFGGKKIFTVFLENGHIAMAGLTNADKVKSEKTDDNTYDDGQWHYISVLWKGKQVKLNIDDTHEITLKLTSQDFKEINLYFGGIPDNVILPDDIPRSYFSGCIEDITINGGLINLASSEKTAGIQSDFCSPNHVNPTPAGPTVDPVDPRKCALELVPATPTISPALRFGSTTDISWWKFDLPQKDKISNMIRFEFKTKKADGLLFYGSDRGHNDFISIYLNGGYVVLAFNCGSGTGRIQSTKTYNKGQWQEVSIKVEKQFGVLQLTQEPRLRVNATGRSKELNIQETIYVGNAADKITQAKRFPENVQVTDTQFVGCIKNLLINKNQIAKDAGQTKSVKSCSMQEEYGTFIGQGGGYLKMIDKFSVGTDMTMSLEVKARTTSGVLVSVHGEKDFMVLEIVKGNVYFSIDNGGDPITAIVETDFEKQICNGKWHKIELKKAKQIILIVVDDFPREHVSGKVGVSETKTDDPLYVGGVPAGHTHRGIVSTEPYVGCIRNFVVNNKAYPLENGKPSGNVGLGFCSTI